MQDDKKLDKVLEKFYNRYNKFNKKVLQQFGEAIKMFDGLNYEEAHLLGQQLKYGTAIDDLINDLSKISGRTYKEINKLFDYVASENVEFAEVLYKARNQEYVDYKNNDQLQRFVNSVKIETGETFRNLSNAKNVGFSLEDSYGNVSFKPIVEAYRDLIDEAVMNTATGAVDYQKSMLSTLRQIADSGIKLEQEKVAYKSGYARRIDSTVRQNILTGVRKINIGIQEQIGKELNADGVEISAHFPCAEDHLDIQGKQFTTNQYDENGNLIKEGEFEKKQAELVRPIGEYNCRHFVFRVILGVQEPSYTKSQLKQLKDDSLEKISYKGKEYTKYEASQIQRRFELKARQFNDRKIIASSAGNKNEVDKCDKKIKEIIKEYNKFSKIAGLRTYKNRLKYY